MIYATYVIQFVQFRRAFFFPSFSFFPFPWSETRNVTRNVEEREEDESNGNKRWIDKKRRNQHSRGTGNYSRSRILIGN